MSAKLGREVHGRRRPTGLLALELAVDEGLLDQHRAPSHVAPLQREGLLWLQPGVAENGDERGVAQPFLLKLGRQHEAHHRDR